ncbi:hypothetical protein [Microbacterium esteraromaticum]|nr:hypothetical protein [Microbacterium esteraromaticum]
MSTHAIEANGNVPAAESTLVNIDPDFHLPADEGNSFARAFRILFPKAA